MELRIGDVVSISVSVSDQDGLGFWGVTKSGGKIYFTAEHVNSVLERVQSDAEKIAQLETKLAEITDLYDLLVKRKNMDFSEMKRLDCIVIYDHHTVQEIDHVNQRVKICTWSALKDSPERDRPDQIVGKNGSRFTVAWLPFSYIKRFFNQGFDSE